MTRTKPKLTTHGTRGAILPRPEGDIEPDKLYLPEEAAGFLRCTMRALRSLVEGGDIPYVPINKRQRRFLGSDILNYQTRARVRALR